MSNTAGKYGGGIDNDGAGAALNVSDCTIASNSAGSSGGGIESEGTTTVVASTFSGNSARYGGAIDNYGDAYSPNLEDDIFAGDVASVQGPEVNQGVISEGHNLVSNTLGSSGFNGPGDLTGIAADLGALGYYGGPTQTIPLLPGSPAIGAGAVLSGVTTDQRGLIRGSTVDSGAFETTLVVESPTGSLDTTAGGLTLSGAVSLADQFAGTAITFDPKVFANRELISLGGSQLALSNTALTTSITGPAAGVTISGGGTSRVFQLDPGVTATLSGLTITGGSMSGFGGGVYADHATLTLRACTISGNLATFGGGLLINEGSATLEYCIIDGNRASADGGGLDNYGGTATLDGCTISSNSADNSGAGIFAGLKSSVIPTTSLINTTVADNSAVSGGGGLFSQGTATLNDCTFSGNIAGGSGTRGYGGGILTQSQDLLSLTDCTITANTATTSGGGIEAQGSVTVTSCTFTTNQASPASGGGGAIDNPNGGEYTITVEDSILSGDSCVYGAEVANAVTSQGHNLISNTANSSGWISSDITGRGADLGPLGDYGGPTQTIRLLSGSPAIGAGTPIGGITTDQRGFPLDSPDPDIGAFQSQSSYALVVQSTGDSGAPAGGFDLRGAVGMAEILGGSRTITFSPTVFATAQTITLTVGQLELSTGAVTIEGPAAGVTISGGDASRVLQIDLGHS